MSPLFQLLIQFPLLPQISWTKDDLPLEERSSDSGLSTVRISRNGLLVIEVGAGQTGKKYTLDQEFCNNQALCVNKIEVRLM